MYRRATAVLVAGVILGLGGYAASAAPTLHGATPTQALCTAGYVDAIIGGVHKCLRAGEFCSPSYESDYERYGFACVDGHLKTGAPTTTTATTTTATTTTTAMTTTAATTTAMTTTATTTTTTTVSTTITGPAPGNGRPTPPFSVGLTVKLAKRTQTTRCTRDTLPDRQCSPGAIYSGLTKSVLCSPTFRTGTIRNVPDSEKHQVEIEYGMTPKAYGRTIEIDHIVSLEIGGSNDIANLYPEPGSGPASYHIKDKLENKLHALVCGGTMTLHAAQVGIERNWETLYKTVFGVAP